MTRLRAALLLAGAGTLVGTLPATGEGGPGEDRARALLARAAHAATTLTWSGTQYVGTWRGEEQSSAVLDVRHRPGAGSTVRTSEGQAAVVTPELDARLLSLLADQYELAVAGSGRCAGRTARVVEARRPGRDGTGEVAGRFWLDTDSGLVLRREVYDADGSRLRSSAFVDLQVEPAAQPAPATVPAVRADPSAALPASGWAPPRELPGGLSLFDARVKELGGGTVLHLAYSDGLSTLSVFAQRGGMPERPRRGFRAERVRGTWAHVQPAAPERVVWEGDGRVFTVVSDAAPSTVRAAVGALPRDPVEGEGLLDRLGRGLSRVGSWLNPFD